MAIKGKSCILALLYSNTTFRATSIKLYFTLTTQINSIKVELARGEPSNKSPLKPGEELTSNKLARELNKELAPLLVKHSKGQPCKNLNIIVFL